MTRTPMLAFAACLALLVAAAAQDKPKEKEKDKDKDPGTIQVCVEPLRNFAGHAMDLDEHRAALIRDLNRTKPSKKAADRRRIAAVATDLSTGGSCPYVLRVTVTDLRTEADPRTLGEQIGGLGRPGPPGPPDRMEPFTDATLDFTLSHNGRDVVRSSVSTRERLREGPTVQLLLTNIAARVNAAVREAAPVWKE